MGAENDRETGQSDTSLPKRNDINQKVVGFSRKGKGERMVNKIKTYWVNKDNLREFAPKGLEKKLKVDIGNMNYVEVIKLSEVKENFLEKSFIKNKLDKFEDLLIETLGWTKPEHHLLRGQLGIKFSILKEELGL